MVLCKNERNDGHYQEVRGESIATKCLRFQLDPQNKLLYKLSVKSVKVIAFVVHVSNGITHMIYLWIKLYSAY